MPKGQPPKAHQFKPGNNANPLGSKAHNPAIRALRNLTEDEMVEVGSLVLKGSVDQLKRIWKDPKSSALKAMMAGVAVKTIAKGDPHALDVLLNRLIGKVKERVQVEGLNAPQVIISLPSNDREKISKSSDMIEVDLKPIPEIIADVVTKT